MGLFVYPRESKATFPPGELSAPVSKIVSLRNGQEISGLNLQLNEQQPSFSSTRRHKHLIYLTEFDSLSLCLSVSLCLVISSYLYLPVCLSVCLSVCLPPPLPLSFPPSLPLPPSLSLSLLLSLCELDSFDPVLSDCACRPSLRGKIIFHLSDGDARFCLVLTVNHSHASESNDGAAPVPLVHSISCSWEQGTSGGIFSFFVRRKEIQSNTSQSRTYKHLKQLLPLLDSLVTFICSW